MERAAFELEKHLVQITRVKLIKWGGSNRWLPLVLPWLLLRGVLALLTNKVEVVYLQDGLLAPLGVVFKLLTRQPVVITLHGRDITYANRLYQFIVPRCLKRLNRIVCVSEATRQQCINRGIAQAKIMVIPNGISADYYLNEDKQVLKKKISERLGVNLHSKKILLSVGRLVERKGIHWFLENVIPALSEVKCMYIIAGNGQFFYIIREIIKSKGLNDSVFMTGSVPEEELKLLYNASDIFVMPNIPVTGDIEGFGLVALEAASCGLPVVAANLEGIREVVKDGSNGFLVEPGSPPAFIERINALLENDEARFVFGQNAREYTLENFGWDKMAREYLKEFSR